jgi:hypothetical protein
VRSGPMQGQRSMMVVRAQEWVVVVSYTRACTVTRTNHVIYLRQDILPVVQDAHMAWSKDDFLYILSF